MTRRSGAGLILVGAVATGSLLAGCTTGSTAGTGAAGTGPTSPSRSATSSTPAPTLTPPHVLTSPTVSAPASGGHRTASSPPAPAANSCTGLTIRVLQGGATPGQEIAAVTFDNTSAKACALSGYPTVVLTHNGNVIATASPSPGSVGTPVRLAPGGQAQAMITDRVSNCNAPLSDTIEVTAPNGAAGGRLTRPFTLRGCAVYVDPVKPSS